MFYRMQHITGLPGEVGILKKHLDGELYLVGNALAGRLVSGPKFQIFDSIICAVAVFVMNAFVIKNRAAKVISHDFSMRENFASAPLVYSGIARRMFVALGINRSPTTTFPTTGLTAKFLVSIEAGKLAFFKQAAIFRCFATQLALKCKRQLDVHAGQLASPVLAVKEII